MSYYHSEIKHYVAVDCVIFGFQQGSLNLLLIKRMVPHPPRYHRVFLKPLLATAGMAVTAKVAYDLLSAPLGSSLATLGAIALAAAVYAVLVVLLRIITKEDLEMLPKGEKLAKILHVR